MPGIVSDTKAKRAVASRTAPVSSRTVSSADLSIPMKVALNITFTADFHIS
jgi:hypothetical protein